MKAILISQNKERKITFVGVMLLVIFMVTVPIPYQKQLYAQSSNLETKKEEKKEPTLEDVYRLLKDIQKKLEERSGGTQEVNGYLTGIKITDWSLYVAWGVATIYHVKIENPSDIAYKDIKIRASYYYSYSTDYGRMDTGTVEGTLPVTLPPPQ